MSRGTLLGELTGGDADHALEAVGEVALIHEFRREGNIDGRLTERQQPLRMSDALQVDVLQSTLPSY